MWQRSDAVPDTHILDVPPDLQPGAYRLSVGLYYAAFTNTILAERAAAPGLKDGATIDWLKVPQPEPPEIPPDAAAVDVVVNGALTLDYVKLRQGEDGKWNAHLYWRGRVERPPFDATVFVHLFNEAGDVIAQNDNRPSYPTVIWGAGEVVETIHPLPFGGSLDGLMLRLGMYTFPGPQNLPAALDGQPVENGVIVLGRAGQFLPRDS